MVRSATQKRVSARVFTGWFWRRSQIALNTLVQAGLLLFGGRLREESSPNSRSLRPGYGVKVVAFVWSSSSRIGCSVTFVFANSRNEGSISRKLSAGPAPEPVNFLFPAKRLSLTL